MAPTRRSPGRPCRKARRCSREKKYKEAAAKFATAADRWPDTPLEEDALFLEAESEFFSDQYPKAHDTYGGLLKKYTNTRYLDTVAPREFALGRYWEQLQDAKPTVAARAQRDRRHPPHVRHLRLRDPGVRAGAAERSHRAVGRCQRDGDGQCVLPRRPVRGRRLQLRRAAQGVSQQQVPGAGPRAGAPGEDAGLPGHDVRPGPAERRQEDRRSGAQAVRQGVGPRTRARDPGPAQIIEEKANREFMLAEYYEQHKYYGAARMYYKA